MPRLLLVYPRVFNGAFGDLRYVEHLTGRVGLLNNSLATIAAMTPRHWQVRLVDENLEPIPYDEPWDLAGITGHAQNDCGDAARIARRLRQRGIPVVCGGGAVTLGPQRWESFADVLFIGEAEKTWPRFLREFEKGRHSRVYRAEGHPDLAASPAPEYSGYPRGVIRRYYGGIVQATRGCPFSCSFCDVVVCYGHRPRHKPVPHIVAEIERLRRLGKHWVVLADDNWGIDRPWARRVVRALRHYNARLRRPQMLFTQTSLDTADDPELIQSAAEAGITRMCIGVESPSPASLLEVNKRPNLGRDLAGALRVFHERGVLTTGTFVLGLDADGPDVFRRQLDFIMSSAIVVPQPYPLQALDNTELTRRLQAEGRRLSYDDTLSSSRINLFNTITFQPRGMSAQQLRDGVLWLNWQLYRPENVVTRLAAWFKQYQESPLRPRLKLLRYGLDPSAAPLAPRLLAYLLLRAPSEERWALRQLLRMARGCSHPQSLMIAVSAFLIMKNVHAVLRTAEPNIETLRPPAPATPGLKRSGR